MLGGRWRAMAQDISDAPGARLRVRWSSLLTSSSSKGVVSKCSALRVFVSIKLSGCVCCSVWCMCSVTALIWVVDGGCGGGGCGWNTCSQCSLKASVTAGGSVIFVLLMFRYSKGVVVVPLKRFICFQKSWGLVPLCVSVL